MPQSDFTGKQIRDESLTGADVQDGTIAEVDLAVAVRTKLNAGDMLKATYDSNNDGRIDPTALASGTPSGGTFPNGAGVWTAQSGLPNLALLRPYTFTPVTSGSFPDSGGELTNGLRATTVAFSDPAYTGWNGFPAQVVVTVDLGQILSLGRVAGNFFSARAAGIWTPVSVNVDVSSDNTTYTRWITGSVPDQVTDSNEIIWSASPALGNAGRYVRFILVGDPTHEFIFVSELEVYGKQVADNDPRLIADLTPVRVVSTNYTVLPSDGTIFVDTTAGPVTITLPTAASAIVGGQGQRVRVKKIDVTANAVTIVATGGQIDGAASAVISTPYNAFEFIPVPGTANWGGF